MGFEMPAMRHGKEKGNEQVWRAEILKKQGKEEADLPQIDGEQPAAEKADKTGYDEFTRDRGGRLEDILPRQ